MKTLTPLFLLAAALIAGLGATGCGSDTAAHAHDSEAEHAAGAEHAHETGTETHAQATLARAEDGVYRNADGKAVCPVMGTVMASDDSAVKKIEWEGTTYHICCPPCIEPFEADPASYLKN
jgi:YHS domain-containing protein